MADEYQLTVKGRRYLTEQRGTDSSKGSDNMILEAIEDVWDTYGEPADLPQIIRFIEDNTEAGSGVPPPSREGLRYVLKQLEKRGLLTEV